MKHEPPMLVATRVYLQRGWKPVPIESGKKAPTLKDWPTIVITPEEAPRYFNGGNVGIRLGRDSGGLVDIDLDCSEAMILAPQFLPPTGAVFGRRSKPCSHQLYVSDLCDTEARAAIQYKEPRPQGGSGATLVELRIGGGAKGAQTVFPPSTHPSGESIIWVDEGEPAKVDGATLKRAVAKLAAACLLLRHYPGEGSRHEAALVLGGLLARGGWTGDAIEEFVTVIANTALDHEAHDRAKSAAAAVDLLARGGAVPGLPRMAELWGKTVAETVVKWLNIPVKVTDDYQREEEQQPAAPVSLGEWDAGDDTQLPPPRGWLLGNTFARRFLCSLLGDGGVGKTAIRYAQYLSIATGRALTGEHVFQRGRVLIISLEDDANELRRRILAARLHHNIGLEEVKGWLFLAAPGAAAGKLMTINRTGRAVVGHLAATIERVVVERKIDLVGLDPFVKSHSVEENQNSLIDDVAQVLTDLAAKYDIAVDVPHHISKGPADPGNAHRGRGASALVDAGRLMYTATTMSSEEAQAFGIAEEVRRQYVRVDSAKVNITRPLNAAKWFHLVGVRLGNENDIYPHGDEVQTVEVWGPPETWGDLSIDLLNQILTKIDGGLADGNRYTDAPRGGERSAWKVVTEYAPTKTEAQAREIIRVWVKNGVLYAEDYDNPVTRKPVKGLRVNNAKRPN